MSEHEKKLRFLLGLVSETYPHYAHEARNELDALLAEQRVTGLNDAMEVLGKRQAEVERQRLASKVRSSAEIADMKSEAATCSKAIHILRAERGRRKKDKEKTG